MSCFSSSFANFPSLCYFIFLLVRSFVPITFYFIFYLCLSSFFFFLPNFLSFPSLISLSFIPSMFSVFFFFIYLFLFSIFNFPFLSLSPFLYSSVYSYFLYRISLFFLSSFIILSLPAFKQPLSIYSTIFYVSSISPSIHSFCVNFPFPSSFVSFPAFSNRVCLSSLLPIRTFLPNFLSAVVHHLSVCFGDI